MGIDREIGHIKQRLIDKVKTNGIYENFGQKEVRTLEDKYRHEQYINNGIWASIRRFSEWCMNYTGKE